MKRARQFFKPLILAMILLMIYTPPLKAGEPCSHLLICCRVTNYGIKFLVNGEWNDAHDYGDINQVRDILQKIKDAGINIVIIDMTNDSQWTNLWEEFEPMVHNIQKVCREKEMQFFMFIGAAGEFSFWNEVAGKIWNMWAQDPSYRRYGYGDDRPILLVFQPSDWYWARYNNAPENEKTYLSRFFLGTTQVNDPILPGLSDGWGYRNYSQSVDGKVRFVSPNGGVPPQAWYQIGGDDWKRRIEWASQAEHYSIYGSYDDVCDGIHWGIADTQNTNVERNKYPGGDPFLYYNILKNFLIRKNQ
jgi:hypothetical protein